MNGERFLLDTNAIVALLQGHPTLVELVKPAEWVGISIISQLEFLCFAGLTEEDRTCFRQFMEKVEVIGIDPAESDLIETTVKIRAEARVKLPDAIIAATAMAHHSKLVTADRHFAGIRDVEVVSF